MEDTLYDTSWNLYYISTSTSSSPSFRSLIHSDQPTLAAHSTKLRDFLTNDDRPRYEDEEEREKIGVLRECTWSLLSHNEPRRSPRGVLVTLTYDKASYKFLLYHKQHSSMNNPFPLLLAKATAPLTKRVISFLAETFHLEISPLKLPPSLLQTTLQAFVLRLYTIFTEHEMTSTLTMLRATLGPVKLTISLSSAGAVAPSLRSVDVDVPAETMYQLLRQAANSHADSKSVLEVLAAHVHERTGLKIPVLKTLSSSAADTADKEKERESIDVEDAVLRLSKLSCAAYAVSVEGRLKFASKAVDRAVEFGCEDEVRRTIEKTLLAEVMEEARRKGNS